tara:strand:- start:823 stop:1239 length:417 start_codon:yes stop_codon:yes gene_type:complete
LCGLFKLNINLKKDFKFVISFFKSIFIWWNRQTFGTFIYTLLTGKFVGSDEFGNKYYINSKGKRWVIYKNKVESSRIPPEWHLWIHFLVKNVPNNNNKFKWQKKYEENLTGTSKAYKPDGSLRSDSKKSMKKYETWKT